MGTGREGFDETIAVPLSGPRDRSDPEFVETAKGC